MVIRLETKIAENGSRANDIANSTQSAKKGSHAATAMAHRLITLANICGSDYLSFYASATDRLPREFAGLPKVSRQTARAALACSLEHKEQRMKTKKAHFSILG